MNYDKVSVKNLIPADNIVITGLMKEKILSKKGVLLGYTNDLDTEREELGSYFVSIEKKPKVSIIPKGFKFGLVEEMKGYFIFTEGVEKMIRMYRDFELFCYVKDNSMEVSKMKPAKGTVLIDLSERKNVTDKGVILESDMEVDPREHDLEAGEVIKVGEGVTNYKKGDIVFFPPHVGNRFSGFKKEQPIFLKVISEQSLFFKEVK